MGSLSESPHGHGGGGRDREPQRNHREHPSNASYAKPGRRPEPACWRRCSRPDRRTMGTRPAGPVGKQALTDREGEASPAQGWCERSSVIACRTARIVLHQGGRVGRRGRLWSGLARYSAQGPPGGDDGGSAEQRAGEIVDKCWRRPHNRTPIEPGGEAGETDQPAEEDACPSEVRTRLNAAAITRRRSGELVGGVFKVWLSHREGSPRRGRLPAGRQGADSTVNDWENASAPHSPTWCGAFWS